MNDAAENRPAHMGRDALITELAFARRELTRQAQELSYARSVAAQARAYLQDDDQAARLALEIALDYYEAIKP